MRRTLDSYQSPKFPLHRASLCMVVSCNGMTRGEKSRQKGNSGKDVKVTESHVIDAAIEAPVDSVTFALSRHVDSASMKIEGDRNSSINEIIHTEVRTGSPST